MISFIWEYLSNLFILFLILALPIFFISGLIAGIIESILDYFHVKESKNRNDKILICIMLLFIASVFTVAVPMTKKEIDCDVKFQTIRHLRDSLWNNQEDTLRRVFIQTLDDNGLMIMA